MKDREKEIKYLIYLKSQIIKEEKKNIKALHQELNSLYNQKRLVKNKNK